MTLNDNYFVDTWWSLKFILFFGLNIGNKFIDWSMVYCCDNYFWSRNELNVEARSKKNESESILSGTQSDTAMVANYAYIYMFSYPSSMWDVKILGGNHHLRTRSWKHWFSIFLATLAICRKKRQNQTNNNILLRYTWTMTVASFRVHSLKMSMISRNDALRRSDFIVDGATPAPQYRGSSGGGSPLFKKGGSWHLGPSEQNKHSLN